MNHSSVIKEFLQTLQDIKHHHWNTTSLAEHKALDKAHSSLSSIMDTVAESLIGREGKLAQLSVKSPMCTCQELPDCIDSTAKTLKEYATSKKYNDLVNIADEVTSIAAKLRYLIRLS